MATGTEKGPCDLQTENSNEPKVTGFHLLDWHMCNVVRPSALDTEEEKVVYSWWE